ncbi:Uncharacterised protein [Mycobacteroides abscessus subsp. abscessus]|nr:Uncharacterised protein [Mycobacteroides abscessus subsp. abscessus]
MAFGVTIGQRQGSDSARLTGNHDLRNRSPGVIGYQVELVNPDAVQKFRDKLGNPPERASARDRADPERCSAAP